MVSSIHARSIELELKRESESVSKPQPEEIKSWLEWGGKILLAMNIPSPAPKEGSSAWPEYVQDGQAYGWTKNRLRAGLPNKHEIDTMDEVLRLPSLVSDINIRRILNARALVTPVANRYIYNWTKIAFMLHSERRRVVRLHYMGLCEIAHKLPLQKASVLRQSITSLSS